MKMRSQFISYIYNSRIVCIVFEASNNLKGNNPSISKSED